MMKNASHIMCCYQWFDINPYFLLFYSFETVPLNCLDLEVAGGYGVGRGGREDYLDDIEVFTGRQ
jgi:hypothetical protein